MTKKLVLALVLLTCSTWVVAQSSPDQPSNSPSQTSPDQSGNSASQNSSTNTNGSGMSETTIRGCLMNSGGSYTLTDSAGAQYQLMGNSSTLSSHANQEVQIKGTPSSANGSSTATGTQGTGTNPVSFQVSRVKKIANSCSTGK